MTRGTGVTLLPDRALRSLTWWLTRQKSPRLLFTQNGEPVTRGLLHDRLKAAAKNAGIKDKRIIPSFRSVYVREHGETACRPGDTHGDDGARGRGYAGTVRYSLFNGKDAAAATGAGNTEPGIELRGHQIRDRFGN